MYSTWYCYLFNVGENEHQLSARGYLGSFDASARTIPWALARSSFWTIKRLWECGSSILWTNSRVKPTGPDNFNFSCTIEKRDHISLNKTSRIRIEVRSKPIATLDNLDDLRLIHLVGSLCLRAVNEDPCKPWHPAINHLRSNNHPINWMYNCLQYIPWNSILSLLWLWLASATCKESINKLGPTLN